MRRHIDWIWAVLAGALLAVMVTINSGLAALTTPFTVPAHAVPGSANRTAADPISNSLRKLDILAIFPSDKSDVSGL